MRDLCEGLTSLAKDAGAAPGVATRWDMSADGKTYTFQLRADGALVERRSGGRRRTSWRGCAGWSTPATASQYAQVIDVIVNAADIIAGKKRA